MLQFYYDGTLGDINRSKNMDKQFIMKLDDEKDLLAKESPVKGLAYHPIPFPTYRSFLVKAEKLGQLVAEHIATYALRTFLVSYDNYGLEVSINYDEGKFVSMILKGSGEQGERIADEIATMFAPKEAKNKKKITIHALLTILDTRKFRGGTQKHEVPKILKQVLMQGFNRYEHKDVVCRPYAIWIDGVRHDPDFIWQEVNDMLLTGFAFTVKFEDVAARASAETFDNDYMAPRRGIIVKDENPDEEGAFPETHYIIDET
jgi:hypothetical protein